MNDMSRRKENVIIQIGKIKVFNKRPLLNFKGRNIQGKTKKRRQKRIHEIHETEPRKSFSQRGNE